MLSWMSEDGMDELNKQTITSIYILIFCYSIQIFTKCNENNIENVYVYENNDSLHTFINNLKSMIDVYLASTYYLFMCECTMNIIRLK